MEGPGSQLGRSHPWPSRLTTGLGNSAGLRKLRPRSVRLGSRLPCRHVCYAHV